MTLIERMAEIQYENYGDMVWKDLNECQKEPWRKDSKKALSVVLAEVEECLKPLRGTRKQLEDSLTWSPNFVPSHKAIDQTLARADKMKEEGK